MENKKYKANNKYEADAVTYAVDDSLSALAPTQNK